MFITFPTFFALSAINILSMSIYVVPFECKCSYSFIQFFMKHLYVLMSLPDDMDMLWIKFFSFFSFFCSANLTCFMIAHIFKDKHKVAGDINSLNLLVDCS